MCVFYCSGLQSVLAGADPNPLFIDPDYNSDLDLGMKIEQSEINSQTLQINPAVTIDASYISNEKNGNT